MKGFFWLVLLLPGFVSAETYLAASGQQEYKPLEVVGNKQGSYLPVSTFNSKKLKNASFSAFRRKTKGFFNGSNDRLMVKGLRSGYRHLHVF